MSVQSHVFPCCERTWIAAGALFLTLGALSLGSPILEYGSSPVSSAAFVERDTARQVVHAGQLTGRGVNTLGLPSLIAETPESGLLLEPKPTRRFAYHRNHLRAVFT
jgi:hypothetical protein